MANEGRIWVYVPDDTPFGGGDPSAAAHYFSPDRKGAQPQCHLSGFAGILQTEAYSGFRRLYEPAPVTGEPRIREDACWAHERQNFHDIWKGTEVGDREGNRIGGLYDIERAISGQSADVRGAVRQDKSKPLVEAFEVWCEHQVARVSCKSDLGLSATGSTGGAPSPCSSRMARWPSTTIRRSGQ